MDFEFKIDETFVVADMMAINELAQTYHVYK